MRVHCTNCGRDGHAKWQCTRPTKSTAARKDVQVIEVGQRPTKVGESQNIAVSPKDRDMADHTARTEKTGSRCRTLPVDTNNPSSPKGSGVESLRTPTEGRKGRDSTSGGARAKLRNPSAVLTQTAAQPPVGTNSSRIENEGVILSASKNAIYTTSAGMVGNKDRHTNSNTGPKGRVLVKGRGGVATSQQGQDALPPIQRAAQAGGKFDKVAYQRVYMARYRAEIKSGKRVPKRKGETT